MKVQEALKQYLQYVKITKAEATYRFDLGKSERIMTFFQNIDCNDVNRKQILDFIVYLKQQNPNIENSTINKYVQLLLRALKSECQIELVFEKLREKSKMVKVVSSDLIKQVFSYYDKEMMPEHLRNNLMFRLLLDTGLRISELLSLNVNDININDSSILVKKTKNIRERVVFFSKETLVVLTKYVMSQKITGLLFIDLNTREQLKLDRVQKICQNLQKSLKTKNSITPHKWRHTFATNFINANGNIEMLRVFLGHTSITTTQRYLHVNLQSMRNEYFRVFGS